ncbi:hypothetical protein ACG04R_09605 [Roseateles sp. BYS78W]|uniref:Uncharacterized protein n=1 Tax=Pelomonas candidula TaxID=3299025 RepID=A0ABW7HAH9_9BURK
MDHRWPARAFVVALHAAALVALWLHRAPPMTDAGERRAVSMRIIVPVQPRKPTRVTPAPTAAVRPSLPTPQAATAPAAATEPAPPAVIHVVPPAEARPAEPPRTALRLTLPPGYAASSAAARNPALSDPRSNTPKPTLEDRIADATGGAGAWVEEPVENHAQSVGAQGEYRTVMRRGSTCVEIFRSRISDNNAFNSSVAPSTVSMIGKPYKCK